MTWSERRRYFLAAERRVLAGEPKAQVLADMTGAGDDPREAARTLARIVSPSRRRRYRWPQRLFFVLVAAAGVAAALSPLVNPFDGGPWFAIGIAWSAFMFGLPLVALLRWRGLAFQWVTLGALFALWWTVRPLLEGSAPLDAGVAALLALYAAVIVGAAVLWRRLFPDVGWGNGDPRRSADGEYLLVD
jgi:hypothetical protein